MPKHAAARLLTCASLLLLLGPACDPSPFPEEEDTVEPSEDPAPDEPGACVPADPCAGAEGTGQLEGFKCDLDIQWINDMSIACEDARATCEAHALEYPGHSYLCTWNGVQIFASELAPGACDDQGPALPTCDEEPPPTCDDPCAGTEGQLGSYYGDICGIDGGSILTEDISCQDALDNCILNDVSNPASGMWCEWNGVEIYRNDLGVDACVAEYGPAPACEGDDDGDDGDDGDDEDPPPPPLPCGDPCEGTEGQLGFYYGDICGIEGGSIYTATISCQDALDNCILNDVSNPTTGMFCEWNGVELYRNDLGADACVPEYGPAPVCDAPPVCELDDPCAGAGGILGTAVAYVGCTDAAGQPLFGPGDSFISCEQAVIACADVAAANPGQSLYCQWNDRSLLHSEVVAGDCSEFPSC